MTLVKTLTATILAATVLVGCDNPEGVASIGEDTLTEAEFGAYLALKRIPASDTARAERALQDYVERGALAKAIADTDVLDTQQMAAELEEFRRQMLISRYFEQYLRDAVDDQAVQNYYSTNATQFESLQAHGAHVLFRVDPNMSEIERQARLTEAQEAYSRLQRGDDFATVAETYSEDRVSAQRGGDLGWLREGAVSPAFSEHLFNLEPGEYTEPFLSPFGFHIVQLIDGPRTVRRPLEAVEGDIRYQLRNETRRREQQRLLESVNVSGVALP